MNLRISLWTAVVVALLNIQNVLASALTTAIPAGARLCFYAEVDKPGEKIGVSSALQAYLILKDVH